MNSTCRKIRVYILFAITRLKDQPIFRKSMILNSRYHCGEKHQLLYAVKLGRRSVRAGAKDSSGQFYLGNRAARDRTRLDDSD